MKSQKEMPSKVGDTIQPFGWESESCHYQAICPDLAWKQPHFGSHSRHLENLVQELKNPRTGLCLTVTNTRNISKFARDGLLRPMDDVLSASELTKYFKPIVDMCCDEGILYAIPGDFCPYVMVARRDVLRKYSFELPTTWKQFTAQAQTLFKKYRRPFIAPLGGKQYSPQSFLSALLCANGLSSERARDDVWKHERIYGEAYDWVRDLMKNGWFYLESMEPNAFRTEDFFENDRWVYRFCWLAELKEKSPAFWRNALIAPLPAGPSGGKPTIFIHSRAWIIPRNSIAPELGMKALRRLLSTKAMIELEKNGGQPFHAHKGVWKTPKILKTHPWYHQVKNFTEEHAYSWVQATNDPRRLASDFVRALQVGETHHEWLSKTSRRPIQDVDGVVKRTVKYVQSHLSEPLTIGKVSKALGKSERHLRRLFKQEMHITATDYIENMKMEKARELLTTTSLSIKEVASKVGFNHDWAFTRAFKRYSRVLPSSLRKTVRKRGK